MLKHPKINEDILELTPIHRVNRRIFKFDSSFFFSNNVVEFIVDIFSMEFNVFVIRDIVVIFIIINNLIINKETFFAINQYGIIAKRGEWYYEKHEKTLKNSKKTIENTEILDNI